MNIKTVLLMALTSLILSGCGDENTASIEKYLKTTSYVKDDGWKVDDIDKIDNYYYVTIKMNKKYEASYKLMYSLSRSSREASSNLESLHNGFLAEMCPTLQTDAGKMFWETTKINYFLLNIAVDGKLVSFDNTGCSRPKK